MHEFLLGRIDDANSDREHALRPSSSIPLVPSRRSPSSAVLEVKNSGSAVNITRLKAQNVRLMGVVKESRQEIHLLHRKIIDLRTKNMELTSKSSTDFERGQSSVLKEWKSSVDAAAGIDLIFGAGLSHRHYTHLRGRSLIYDARKDRQVKSRIPVSGELISQDFKSKFTRLRRLQVSRILLSRESRRSTQSATSIFRR